MNKKEIVITSATRTAVGSLGKTLKSTPSEELGASVISEAIKRSKIESKDSEKFRSISTSI